MFMLDCPSTWLYELPFWRTPMTLQNTGKKIADWLLHSFIHCDYFHVLTIWTITASIHKFRGCCYDEIVWSNNRIRIRFCCNCPFCSNNGTPNLLCLCIMWQAGVSYDLFCLQLGIQVWQVCKKILLGSCLQAGTIAIYDMRCWKWCKVLDQVSKKWGFWIIQLGYKATEAIY